MRFLGGLCALCILQEALTSVIRDKGLRQSVNVGFQLGKLWILLHTLEGWISQFSGG